MTKARRALHRIGESGLDGAFVAGNLLRHRRPLTSKEVIVLPAQNGWLSLGRDTEEAPGEIPNTNIKCQNRLRL